MFHEQHFVPQKQHIFGEMIDRKYQKRNGIYCSNCGGKIEENRVGKQRYCKKCHAANMKETRPKYSELTPEQRKRSNARAYAKEYFKRGIIVKMSCVLCGDENSEMHHEDYNKPTEVIWYCRSCHLKKHNAQGF